MVANIDVETTPESHGKAGIRPLGFSPVRFVMNSSKEDFSKDGDAFLAHTETGAEKKFAKVRYNADIFMEIESSVGLESVECIPLSLIGHTENGETSKDFCHRSIILGEHGATHKDQHS
jgi:hypothetical protein